MSKKVSRKNLVKRLDNIFSQYIRLRNANAQGISECYTCGKQDHWKSLQAGHFMSRKHYATRWDEDNVEVQCMGCNVYRYGEQYLFAKHLGEDKADRLLIKSRQIQKFTDIELLELIEYYKHKVDNL